MRERQFDVIHAHHYEGLMVAAAANVGQRLPVVYDAHTLLMSELPSYSLGLPADFKQWLGRRMDSWIPRLADHIVCVTDTIHDRLVSEAGFQLRARFRGFKWGRVRALRPGHSRCTADGWPQLYLHGKSCGVSGDRSDVARVQERARANPHCTLDHCDRLLFRTLRRARERARDRPTNRARAIPFIRAVAVVARKCRRCHQPPGRLRRHPP